MANQNNYDNYPNGYDPRYGADPRYQAERPQGASPRPTYPEPSRYGGGQGYGSPYRTPGREPGYDPYRDGRDPGYYREPSRGRGYPDPYREPQGGYDRGYRDGGRGPAYDPYAPRAPRESYGDPYADPYADRRAGYDGEGYDEPETEEEPADAPRGYAFKVRNLTKDYDGNVVLNNISFDIPAGKIVGLLGPNGCGKTTLIKILSGLIHDYTGMIKIGGRPVGIASKASVAYLPDRTYFPERFRTIDCINYFADFFTDFDKIKAIEFASRFGLDLHQRVRTMSKGMQEKLQLLVVMSRAADIYLLDEPLGGVDPAARGVILDIIMSNYKKNATVVLSTHQVNDLEHSFDHVLMLGHGQVLVNTGIETLRSTGKSVEDIFKEVIGDAWEVE